MAAREVRERDKWVVGMRTLTWGVGERGGRAKGWGEGGGASWRCQEILNQQDGRKRGGGRGTPESGSLVVEALMVVKQEWWVS
jgi:hypothetical protein